MQKFCIAAALTGCGLVAAAHAVSAVPIESDHQLYRYGAFLGWAGAECNAYEQGKIPQSWLINTFTRIGLDKELNDYFKSALFETIENNKDFSNCAEVLKEWKNGSN